MIALRALAIAATAGLVLGVATQLGQSHLPEGVSQLANSIAPWLSVAFVVGALQSSARTAAAAGLVTLAFALVGYYAMVLVRFGYTGGSTSLLLWSIGSIAGGFVFGPAGWSWRIGSFRARTIAVALLGSAWVAEAMYLAFVLSMKEVAVVYGLVGLAVPLLLGRTWQGRLLAWATMVPTIALGGLGFAGLIKLNEVLAGV